MGIRDLKDISHLYFLPRDNFVTQVVIPCLKRVTDFRCMMGFFNSTSLREIAPGLAEFLQHDGRMHLLMSPYISAEDQKALREGTTTPPELLITRLQELLGEAYVSEQALVRYTLNCLAYLIAANHIEIKIVLIPGAIFHPKVWIFIDGDDVIVAHGSSNMTSQGLTANFEHISVVQSWTDRSQASIIGDFMNEFESHWQGNRTDAITVDLPNAIRKKLLTDYKPDKMPTSSGYMAAWRLDHSRGQAPKLPKELLEKPKTSIRSIKFEIPDGLIYDSGDFAHQGKAVQAWEATGGRGILEMATGSGKTATALICARRLFEKTRPLFIVVAAPYIPLISQWEGEIQKFGIRPYIPSRESNKSTKLATIEEILQRRMGLGFSDVECTVITHDFLCDSDFHATLKRWKGDSLLIGDEVHNLGRSQFIKNPPEFFTYRLGLSATPVRQYDEVGTKSLLEYFGDVAFRYGLAEAIGTCLVPYEYYVHPVRLNDEELGRWIEFTEQLRKHGWLTKNDSDDSNHEATDYIKALLRKRRLVLEQAESKIVKLRRILKSIDPKKLRHTLIYCSDKGPEQLQQVNILLSELGVLFHQVTAEETDKAQLADQILKRFAHGDLQVLTAKRVLDEGVNIPEVKAAFILASTTVERQWIQRRGRLLRKCPAIGKKSAVIHDFIVLPPDNEVISNREIRQLIKSELQRVMEFAKLAKNAGLLGGPLETVHPIYGQYFAGGR